MYEGVITLYLCDPFSILISNFFSVPPDTCNAIGYYYHRDQICYVSLFNTFSAHKIYLSQELTLLELMKIGKNIKLYPLIFDLSFGNPILTVEEINSSKKITREQFFQAIMRDTATYTTITDYRVCLSQTDNHGYMIINRTLYLLRNKSTTQITTERKITNLSIFKPVVQIPERMAIPETIIAQSKVEIAKFFEAIIEENMMTACNIVQPAVHLSSLDKLMYFLYEGFMTGALDKLELQTIIKELNKEKKQDLWPIPNTELEQLNIINFSHSVVPEENIRMVIEHKNLQKIRNYLENLTQILQTEEHPILNLQYLIHHLNKILPGHEIAPISDTVTEVTKTFLLERSEIEKIPVGTKNFSLTCDNPKLEDLTKEELIKLLIYLDSTRSEDGIQDKKFIALQNKIIARLDFIT